MLESHFFLTIPAPRDQDPVTGFSRIFRGAGFLLALERHVVRLANPSGLWIITTKRLGTWRRLGGLGGPELPTTKESQKGEPDRSA